MFSKIIQYSIGFSLWATALFLSPFAFAQNNIFDFLYYMAIACLSTLSAFLFTKDLIFIPLEKAINSFFFSTKGQYKDELSHIETLISNHHYHEALKQLETHLDSQPDSSLAYLKICEILYYKLHNVNEALDKAYTKLNAETLCNDDERLIFLALDMLEENTKVLHAQQLLQAVLPKINDQRIQASLHSRLNIINSKIPQQDHHA